MFELSLDKLANAAPPIRCNVPLLVVLLEKEIGDTEYFRSKLAKMSLTQACLALDLRSAILKTRPQELDGARVAGSAYVLGVFGEMSSQIMLGHADDAVILLLEQVCAIVSRDNDPAVRKLALRTLEGIRGSRRHAASFSDLMKQAGLKPR